MTISELRARLVVAHGLIGREGRFALTIDQCEGGKTYITHWLKAGDWAFEKCKAVGVGSVEDCLAALDAYVASYRPAQAPEMLAAE